MKSSSLVLCFLFLFSPAIAFAQKPNGQEPVGIFPTQGEYNQFMGSVKMAAAEDPQMESMIGLINDIVLNQPIGSTSKQYGTDAGTPLSRNEWPSNCAISISPTPKASHRKFAESGNRPKRI